jgi:hypothetical protein
MEDGLKRLEVRQVVKLLLYPGTLVSWEKSMERNERLEWPGVLPRLVVRRSENSLACPDAGRGFLVA